MHLAIRYSTRFDYPEEVRQSHNEVRGAPTTDAHQTLLAYRLTCEPPSRAFTYYDAWGTQVDAFGVRLFHDHLAIEIDAVVETLPRTEPDLDAPGPEGAAPGDRWWEYLQPTHHAQLTPRVRELAEDARRDASTPGEVLDRLTAHVHGSIAYEPGATEIGEHVDDILEKGRGVCQDHTHVLLAAARSIGIPARYVSGYLYARHDTGAEVDPNGDALAVQTHAWVELLAPNGEWVPRDATNLRAVGERHVKIGHGRDYDDVAPVRGVYVGGGDPTLVATVEMRPVLAPERPSGPPRADDERLRDQQVGRQQ